MDGGGEGETINERCYRDRYARALSLALLSTHIYIYVYILCIIYVSKRDENRENARAGFHPRFPGSRARVPLRNYPTALGFTSF